MTEVNPLSRDDAYVRARCARSFARAADAAVRHGAAGDPPQRYADAWQYPLVDCHDPADRTRTDGHRFCDVTFVVPGREWPAATAVAVLGTATGMTAPRALRKVAASDLWALTIAVPRGGVHRYRYLVDGGLHLDPVNPQIERAAGGGTWSRFSTWQARQPLTFEEWQWLLLDRLIRQILPFEGREAGWFRQDPSVPSGLLGLHRLCEDIGVTNAIDKLLAREERHRAQDYHVCLRLIATVLRRRNPFEDPVAMQSTMYAELYDDLAACPAGMASGSGPKLQADGWDRRRYDNPAFFLAMLRRHAICGAFAHPRHGGNSEAAGWRFLDDQFGFAWHRSMEASLVQACLGPQAVGGLDGYRG